ncbi:hypothetical protein [Streptomyces sp. CB03911]|uniref:hypothetical protein n=1 Tax=Streptomyces sp. CB03911 TaxID=1804758 RepID=UPI0018FEDE1D|nr:hypothetical protein [Streptomyces sp. CB03911]
MAHRMIGRLPVDAEHLAAADRDGPGGQRVGRAGAITGVSVYQEGVVLARTRKGRSPAAGTATASQSPSRRWAPPTVAASRFPWAGRRPGLGVAPRSHSVAR